MTETTDAAFIAELRASDNTRIVAYNGSFAWTRAELASSFARVEHPTNWKYPVSARVAFRDDRELLGTYEAVKFFTGSIATIVERVHGRLPPGGKVAQYAALSTADDATIAAHIAQPVPPFAERQALRDATLAVGR